MDTVTIRSFNNYITASMLLSRLQHDGLECYLKDEFTVTIDPMLSNAIGGIKLIVRSEDLEKALTLLREFDDEYLKAAKCPQCGATAFSYISKPGPTNFLTAVLTWMFAGYAIAPIHIYHCNHCGYETKTLPDPDYSTEE
jgi:hypothetical protein